MKKEYQLKGIIPPIGAVVPSHIVYDTCESIILNGSSPAGNGFDWVATVSSLSRGGRNSILLSPKATSPTAGDYVYISFRMPFYASNLNLIELAFLLSQSNKVSIKLEIYTNYKDPKVALSGVLKLNCETGEIFIRDENLNYIKIYTLNPIPVGYWSILGMVVDLEKENYISVRFSTIDIVVNRSDVKFYKVNTLQPTPIVNVFVELNSGWSSLENRPIVHIDNLLVMGILK